jgi:Tfp pilus assembly protein FimT
MLSATGLGNAIERQSQRTVLHDLYHLILMTRTLAVREETYYTLCASHDNIHCDETWQDRVIVFRDRNKNEQVDNDDSIYRQLLLPNGIRCLEWYSGRHFLQFKPTGASNGTAGHFRFCDSTNNYLEKKLVVSFQGRTSLKDL